MLSAKPSSSAFLKQLEVPTKRNMKHLRNSQHTPCLRYALWVCWGSPRKQERLIEDGVSVFFEVSAWMIISSPIFVMFRGHIQQMDVFFGDILGM